MLPRVRPSIPVFCLLCVLVLPWHAQAQVFPRGNGISLANLAQTDLYVEVANWAGMPGDSVEFRRSAHRLLETALQEAGISRRPAHRNYLVCSVQAIQKNERVASTIGAQLWTLRSTDVHTLLWEKDNLGMIDPDQFDAELVASECAEYFIGEWSRWNQS